MKLFLIAFLSITPIYCINSKIAERCEEFEKEAKARHEYQPDDSTYKAKQGEFPHVAAIIYKNTKSNRHDIKCGGTLISKKHVLLPAHCVSTILKNVKISHVRLGSVQITKTIVNINPESDYEVQAFKVHPGYHSRNQTNNVAVIELSAGVVFDNNVRPACLHNEDSIDFGKLILTEWGKNSDNENDITLYKTKIKYVEPKNCSEEYATKYHKIIRNDQICGSSTRMDTCQGEFGGPLQVPNGKLFTLVGIPSHGERCGSSFPAVYTSVNKHLDWIGNVVWE